MWGRRGWYELPGCRVTAVRSSGVSVSDFRELLRFRVWGLGFNSFQEVQLTIADEFVEYENQDSHFC